jgi:putative hemin transport protein
MNTLTEPLSLTSRWESLRAAEPHLRPREAAARLGTSEATLLSLQLGTSVRRLRCLPVEILKAVETLGPLMALTRNEAVVHERRGVYGPLEAHGNVGLINNPDIDLRLEFTPWVHAFAEVKSHAGRTLRSLQFFDPTGTAVHKIYLDDEARAADWEALVNSVLHDDQSSLLEPEPRPAVPPCRTTTVEEVLEVRKAWDLLKDPHHFHALLRKNRITRGQAFAAVAGLHSRSVPPTALLSALEAASRQGLPIMVFVGNRGCIQIHTGPVADVRPLGRWVNVLDPLFNLHVDLDQVAEAWVVEKPSPDGIVTSLELLDAQGEAVVQVFGERKPGRPERRAWQNLAAKL